MNFILLVLVSVAIAWIQCWTGGTRLAFSLPAFGVLAVAAIVSLPGIRRRGNPAWLSCLAVALALFCYLAMRAWHSPVDYLWWSDFYTLIAGFTAYLLVALYLTGPTERTWLMIVLLIVALGHALIGLEQFVKDDNFMLFGFMRPALGRRASGFFVGPNVLAGYLEVIGIVSFSLVFWSRWRGWVRGIFAYLCAVCYFGLAITGSRGGYLSAAVSIVVFGLLSLWAVRKIDPHRLSGALLTGVTVFTALFLIGSALMSKSFLVDYRLSSLGKALSENSDVRTYNWQAALDQFHQQPAIGTGAGTYLYFGRLFRRVQLQSDPIHAHSDYLELLAEYGIVGLAGVVVFILAHFRAGVRSIADLAAGEAVAFVPPRTNALALQIGALSAMAALLVHAAFDFNFHIPGNALVYAVVFGILSGSRVRKASQPGEAPASEPEEEPVELETTAFRLMLPVLGLWMCASGLPKLPGETLGEQARVALDRHLDFARSIELGHKALMYERRNPQIYFNLGEAYRNTALEIEMPFFREPVLRSAIASYQEGLKIFPYDESLWLRMAQSYDRLGEFKKAEESFQKVLALDPNLGILRIFHAAHLKEAGRVAEAEEELTRAAQMSNNDIRKVLESVSASPRQNGIRPRQ